MVRLPRAVQPVQLVCIPKSCNTLGRALIQTNHITRTVLVRLWLWWIVNPVRMDIINRQPVHIVQYVLKHIPTKHALNVLNVQIVQKRRAVGLIVIQVMNKKLAKHATAGCVKKQGHIAVLQIIMAMRKVVRLAVLRVRHIMALPAPVLPAVHPYRRAVSRLGQRIRFRISLAVVIIK